MEVNQQIKSGQERDKTSVTNQSRGYLIANYTIHDQETYAKYVQAAGALNATYKLRPIIYDAAVKAVEGEPESVIAIAEFESFADAERFYNSVEYQQAMKFRLASTEGWVFLAESALMP